MRWTRNLIGGDSGDTGIVDIYGESGFGVDGHSGIVAYTRVFHPLMGA